MITAVNNKGVKRVIALKKSARDRRENGSFIVEGVRMFEETPDELIKSAYVTSDFYNKYANRGRLDKIGALLTSDEVFAKMSDTVTPQGILLEVAFPENSVEKMISKENAFLLCLQDIQDPGNLGTMLRTAEGAGVSGVIMSRGCVDIYSPKVVRSTMGAIYRMPFAYSDDLVALVPSMQKMGIKVYAAALREDSRYTDKSYLGKCAILIGNEGNGLTKEIIDVSDEAVTIPMEGQVESLNAAMSAGIIMYEAKRQRDSIS